jgi:hypothetical protein
MTPDAFYPVCSSKITGISTLNSRPRTRPETRKREQHQRVQRDRDPEARKQRALLRFVVEQCRRTLETHIGSRITFTQMSDKRLDTTPQIA